MNEPIKIEARNWLAITHKKEAPQRRQPLRHGNNRTHCEGFAMNDSTSAKIVPFRQATLLLVEHDGQPFVPMKPVVEGMGLTWAAQTVKLNSNKARWGVSIIEIPSSGGVQSYLCIPLRKLVGWLNTIHPNKVRPELRENVIAYQNECDDALWAYWNNGIAVRNTAASNPGLLNLAFSLAAEATSQVSRTVFEAVMAGKDDWRHDRWLLALNWGGENQHYQPVVQAIPRDAAVMTQGQYLRAMTEGNGLYVSTPDLSQFIEAATKKLARRCTFYEGQAAGKAVELHC